MKKIHINKGLDIPIGSAPSKKIIDAPEPSRIAVLGDDYIRMKPSFNFRDGDSVKKGDVLFTDKKMDGVRYISPASGKIIALNRGEKRRFLSLEIEPDGYDGAEFRTYNSKSLESLDEEILREYLMDSGHWVSLRARPFNKTANPAHKPDSIFVTAAESRPLGLSAKLGLEGRGDEFLLGVKALSKLAQRVYVCVSDENDVPVEDIPGVEYVCFTGKHPAGLVGTHMHFLRPAHRNRIIWHINWQDTADIGYTMLSGRMPDKRIIAVGGKGVKEPCYMRTYIGASTTDILKNRLEEGEQRVIAGSVLYGRKAEAPVDYIHRYIPQITVIPEGRERKLLGWAGPGFDMHSQKRIFATAFGLGKPDFDTSLNGSHRPIIPVGNYESVMPLDIIATYLLRAISVQDAETAQKLGCLELDGEDLSLCTYVCAGKNDYAPMLEQVLETIEKES
ncbi:Na(+)-translocating NADH-quinone reductase subunit A [Limisalsivibrio acetivorans]|uniref:Na(+)-translocating NADH-quinone reductase subunit A n=1 Tax=Limisalsivibrio acetivorans TaxID=1304888 RepID=UPI0003F5BE07|nr:Na(+)-translocating NADH-quinone reductase subunit A [Limisalsivibrio acetivorans]